MRLLARSVLLLLSFAFVSPAFAQKEPPARVGRVSIVSGTLAFFGPGDSDWSAARVNLPVAAGAWLATDPQSRAERRAGRFRPLVPFARLPRAAPGLALSCVAGDDRL